MISRSAEYALRAVLHIAGHTGDDPIRGGRRGGSGIGPGGEFTRG